jgi:MFS family permease
MSSTSAANWPPALAPLQGPVFRMLWLAWLAANISMWMNDVAAAWLMTSLTDSAVMVALVQAASTLPVFVLGLPSGALADTLDRRRYFAGTQLWVALVAVVLCLVSLAGALTAPLLLLLTFANGVGLALRWPVFAAIVPELVDRQQLPAALALNGVAMNMSRIIGPVFAGALLASVGGAYVFLVNAVLAVIAFTLIWRWRSVQKPSALPGERFVGAMRVGLQHVWQSPRMRAIWVRVFLFFIQSISLTALLPLIARQNHGGSASAFTVMLAAMGAGAITMVMLMPRLRHRLPRDRMVQVGTLLHAAMACGVVLSPTLWLAVPAMFVSGMAWIGTANTLTVTAQLSLPNWVRARGMSIYQMGLMGGSAAGAAIWGQLASWTDLRTAIFAAAGFGLVTLLAARKISIGGGDTPDDDMSPALPQAMLAEPAGAVDPDAGPVMVTVEYRIDPAQAAAFRAAMRDTRAARLRQGALSWGLFKDVSVPGRYIEYFLDETWIEHLRRHERFTAADVDLRERRLAFHVGGEPPRVKRYVDDEGD